MSGGGLQTLSIVMANFVMMSFFSYVLVTWHHGSVTQPHDTTPSMRHATTGGELECDCMCAPCQCDTAKSSIPLVLNTRVAHNERPAASSLSCAPCQCPACPAAAPATATAAAHQAAAGPRKARNAVMGMAKDIKFPFAYRFVRSLREHAPDVDIIIWTDDVPADLKQLYTAFGVTVQRFDVSKFPARIQKYHPSSYRWLLIDELMKELETTGKPYDNVMFVDVRDTVYQRDPFVIVDGHPGFHAFLEAATGPPIRKCGWNSGWIKDCFGEKLMDKLGDRPISCSGTSIASWKAALQYTNMMAKEIRTNQCERNGVDQGMHNVWVHDKRLDKVILHSNEQGLISTVQSMKELPRDRFGRVLNANKKVVAVVHQYDRSPELMKQYEAQFIYLPTDVLNVK